MARNPRFERFSTSPDGSNFPRSGTSLHGDNLPLSQVLLLDKLSMGDQTYYHHPELKRVTNAVVGTLAEDPSLGPVQAKPLSSLGVEELKKVRSCVTGNSLKARERINILNEAIYRLDRYQRPMLLRKRSRIELPEPVPNKQVCTSMMIMQVEGRPNNMHRPSVMTDRERDILSSGKAASESKHKDWTLPAGIESREKEKMTGRSSGMKSDGSVKTVASKILDGDKNYKQGIQKRPSIENHSRPSESHGFRSNVHNKNHAASPTKGKGSHEFVKSSPNVFHTSPTFDSEEKTSNPNRGQITGGPNSCKLPFSTGSSSTPVTWWSKKKPPKHQRTKRTNLVPPVSDHDDLPDLVKGSSIPKSVAKQDSTESSGQGILRCSSNNSAFQQKKLNNENISSLAVLSESKESGAGDKCQNKIKKQGDAAEKIAPVCPKVGSLVLPLNKAKTVIKEKSGDGIQRPGWSGRTSTPLRMNAPLSGKLENPATTKQLRRTRLGTDTVARKTGQPPTKKTPLVRKPVTLPRSPMNCGLSDFTGDLDDSEELLAAVKASNNASDVACSGPFWKQMEPFFAPLTQDNLDFLKHLMQVREVEDERAILISPASNRTGEADLICSMLPENPSPIILCNQRSLVNAFVDNESLKQNANEDIERPGMFRCFDRMPPLSQRLLSALIVEEDSEETNRKLYDGPQDDCLHCTKFRGLDEPHAHGGKNNQGELQSSCQNFGLISVIAANDIQSQEMDLDQRILLELQSIELFPVSVPELAHREDEEIKMEICKLEDVLQQEVSKEKRHLHKLEKADFKRQKVEEREHEGLAMDKLVESAYNRHMGVQGTNASGRKSAQNKVTKKATLGFVKRTQAKCRMFEETGKSCFSDASLKERMFSISSKEMDKKFLSDAVKGDTAKMFADNAHALSDIKTSANPTAPSEQSAHIVAQHAQKLENGDWQICSTRQGTASYPLETVVKDDVWSTCVKTRELILEEVKSSGFLRDAAALGIAPPWGAKRKRTKRDREGKVQTKEIIIKSGSNRSGQPDLGNAKGEMKNKLKLQQKMVQISATANDLLGKPSEAQKPSLMSNYWEKPSNKMVKVKDGVPASQNSISDDDTSHDNNPIDLSHVQLPNLEDYDSWLNIEDDSLPDVDSDYMGLSVPMDDLADLNML